MGVCIYFMGLELELKHERNKKKEEIIFTISKDECTSLTNIAVQNGK